MIPNKFLMVCGLMTAADVNVSLML